MSSIMYKNHEYFSNDKNDDKSEYDIHKEIKQAIKESAPKTTHVVCWLSDKVAVIVNKSERKLQ